MFKSYFNVFKFCAGVFLLSVTAWVFLISINYVSDFLTRNPNRCEIQGLLNNCPAQPTLQILRSDGILFDDARSSSRSQEVCMSRAKEFHDWCRSEKPISAQFYRESRLIAQSSYPSESSTRCEIHGLLNNCPAQPKFQVARSDGILHDNARDSFKSQEVCMARAREFHDWCRSEKPISAHFFQGSKPLGKMTFP